MSRLDSQDIYDKESAKRYRQNDEKEVLTGDHASFCSKLRELSRSFGREITALDLGCGTGRYFHCLDQVNYLIGVDLSPHMLEQARHPVRQQEVSVTRIETICADLLEMRFPPQSFDLIYSLGVLGESCPFELGLCNRLHDWLKPGGKLFFSTVDIASKPGCKSFKRRVVEAFLPWLPGGVAKKLTQRFSTHYMTAQELHLVMRSSKFRSYEIFPHVSTSPWWHGTHLLCLAHKGH